MNPTEQTEAEIAAWAERNAIYPLSAARLAFEDAATSDYAKQQAVNERCALLEQRGALAALASKWLEQFVETCEGLDPEEAAEVNADRAVIARAKLSP